MSLRASSPAVHLHQVGAVRGVVDRGLPDAGVFASALLAADAAAAEGLVKCEPVPTSIGIAWMSCMMTGTKQEIKMVRHL